MDEKRVPPAAWVLSGATAVAVGVLAAGLLITHGESQFFVAGDPRMFLLTARDLFGTGHGFAALGRASEVPYRYGRVGLPLLGWLLALGRPAFVGWTMIGVNLAALAAIPGLAALLLVEHRAPPAAGAVILVLPAFLVLYGSVVADPLLLALLLLAYLLDARSHRRSALAVLAYAILVKEIAVLALVPLLWRALRGDERWGAGAVVATVVPYAAWCSWLRWRVGEFPFLAHTRSRTGAAGLPLAGIRYTLVHRPLDSVMILGAVAATIALGAAGAWVASGNQIGGLAAVYTFMTMCLGSEALRFAGETLRVLLLPQVFGVLALTIGISRAASRREAAPDPQDHGLFVGMADL